MAHTTSRSKWVSLFVLLVAHLATTILAEDGVGGEGRIDSDVAKEHTKKVLPIPNQERSWKTFLTDGNLRPSNLWIHSTWNLPRTIPLLKDIAPDSLVRRGFELFRGTSSLTPNSDAERRFADQAMSNMKFEIPDPDEVAKQQKETLRKKREAAAKKRSAAQISQPEPIQVVEDQSLESLPEHSPTKKANWKGLVKSTSKGQEQLSIAFPLDVSSFDKPASFLLKSEDLIFPADKNHLKEVGLPKAIDVGLVAAFQAFQTQLHVKGEFADYRNKSMKTIDNLRKAEKEAAKKLVKANDELKKVQEELRKSKEELAMKHKEVQIKDDQYKALLDRLNTVAVEAICTTRVKLMREYLAGKHTEWKPEVEIADWEEAQCLDEEEALAENQSATT